MVILFILLQLADAWTTLRILDAGGKELNPFLAKLFAKFGAATTLAVVKLTTIVIVVIADTDWLTIGGCVLYAVVVVNNVRVMRGMK